MDIDATFLPVAEELVGNVFPTQITYHHSTGIAYDTATGVATPAYTDYEIPAGVLSSQRVEDGGIGELYEITIWIHHGDDGMPEKPKTGDYFTYDAIRWKVTTVAPTYSSKNLIASKIVARTN